MLAIAILTEVIEQLRQTLGQLERLDDQLAVMKPSASVEDQRASTLLVRRAIDQVRRSRKARNPRIGALYPPLLRFAPVDLSVQGTSSAHGLSSPQRTSSTIRPADVPLIVARVLKAFRLTKIKLAVATGVPRTMITKWETGRVSTDIPVRLQELDELRDVLESRLAPEEIRVWLKIPNDVFGNETPAAWLHDGRARHVTWAFTRMPTPVFRRFRPKPRKKRLSSPSPPSRK